MNTCLIFDLDGTLVDSLPGIGPARRRAILQHFGSPERFMSASREELEAVPGLPPKVARDLYEHLSKGGTPEQSGAVSGSGNSGWT